MSIANAEPDIPDGFDGDIDVNSPDAVVYQIGMSLMLTQDTEYAILTALRLIFNDRVIDLSELTAPDRRTLGTLLKSLRKEADIAPEFDDILKEFLKLRNVLAHELTLQPWFEISTEDGREAIWAWLKAYFVKLNDVLMVFTAYNLNFLQRLGATETPQWLQMEKNNFIKYINEGYRDQLPNLVRKKKP